MTIPVMPDLPRVTTYSPVNSTGPFDVGFDLYGDSTDYAQWLEVWLNGEQLTAVTHWTLASATGPFATIGRPITNAKVTLVNAATGTLVIVGAQRPRRTSQLTEGRGVSANDFNRVVTELKVAAREYWDRITRMVIARPGDSVGYLPTATQRQNAGAGSLFVWDSAGNPSTAPINSAFAGIGSISTNVEGGVIPEFTDTTAGVIRASDHAGYVYATVATAQAATIPKIAKYLRTQGYAAAGDGGAAFYKRVDAEPSHPGKFRSTDRYLSDGTTSSSNGGWWEIAETRVFAQMFGAKGDGAETGTFTPSTYWAAGKAITSGDTVAYGDGQHWRATSSHTADDYFRVDRAAGKWENLYRQSTSPGSAWATSTAYNVSDKVTWNSNVSSFECLVAHTSGTFPTHFLNSNETATAWASTTVYALGAVVTQGGNYYRCIVAHTAGVFADDLAALKWSIMYWKRIGNWLTATAYKVGDVVNIGTAAAYRCIVAHTAGTFATDLATAKWVAIAFTGTDDTDALQNAITYATAKRCPIYLKGFYRIADNVAVRGYALTGTYVNFIGSGPETSGFLIDDLIDLYTSERFESFYNVGSSIDRYTKDLFSLQDMSMRGRWTHAHFADALLLWAANKGRGGILMNNFKEFTLKNFWALDIRDGFSGSQYGGVARVENSRAERIARGSFVRFPDYDRIISRANVMRFLEDASENAVMFSAPTVMAIHSSANFYEQCNGFEYFAARSAVVTGNTFKRCRGPIAIGNSFQTQNAGMSPTTNVILSNNVVFDSIGGWNNTTGALTALSFNPQSLQAAFVVGSLPLSNAMMTAGYPGWSTGSVVNDPLVYDTGDNSPVYGFASSVVTNLTTTNTSTSATVASATGLFVGMMIVNANVPAGTKISALAGTTVTLSAAATATGTATATFIPTAAAQGFNFLVANNSYSRTLPTLTKISYQPGGDMLYTANGWKDVALADSNFAISGVRLSGDVRDALVQGNVISGVRAGQGIALVQKSNTFSTGAPDEHKSFSNVVFDGNVITDCRHGLITDRYTETTAGNDVSSDITVRNNKFNLDPYILQTARKTTGMDGSWLDSSDPLADTAAEQPTGICMIGHKGWNIFGNTFENCWRPINFNGSALQDKARVKNNLIKCQPAALNFSTSNKGVGLLYNCDEGFDYQVWDCDPTSATFGKLLNTCPSIASAQPSSGSWVAGQRVYNSDLQAPIEYWLRRTTGSSHASYTDWDWFPRAVRTVAYTDSTTMVAGDLWRIVEITKGTGVNYTFDTNANVPCPKGTMIFFRQGGAGQITFAAAGGVTLNSPGALVKTFTTHSTAFAYKTDTNTWQLGGDLSA